MYPEHGSRHYGKELGRALGLLVMELRIQHALFIRNAIHVAIADTAVAEPSQRRDGSDTYFLPPRSLYSAGYRNQLLVLAPERNQAVHPTAQCHR